MRLTLRTLLAYLDDTLEPAEARLMGQKVAESPAAQELVARIREATRRRIESPPDGQPGARFDPNTIAEYLDNVLAPEKVTEVEEACLASDAHLAEVTMCHQILTLVLGEPVQVPPLAKQRMYALVKEPRPTKSQPARSARAAEPAHEGHDEADEMLLLGLPRHLGQGPWRRWLVPAAVIVLLLAVLGGAVWLAVSGLMSGPHPVSIVPTAPGPEPVAQAGNNDKRGPGQNGKNLNDKKPQQQNPDNPKQDQQKPDDKKLDGQMPQPQKAPDRRPNKKPPSKERRKGGEFVSADSILLRQGEDKQWQRVRRGETVSTNEPLVSLPGYRSEVRPESQVRLVLWGSLPDDPRSRAILLESAVMLHADPAVDLDFTLDHGRVVLSNHKEKGPATVRIRFHGDEVWELTLNSPDTEVGLELWGSDPLDLRFAKDRQDDRPMAVLGLFVLKGEATVHADYEEYTMPAQSRYVWDSLHGPGHRVEALPQLPDWAKRFPGQPLQVRARQALDNLSRTLTGKDVDIALAATLREQDPISRILAVFCLGAISDLPNLLDALADERHGEVRGTAAFVLRYWLNLRPENRQELREVMTRKGYTTDQAEIVVQLLHTFSEADINQPATYEALIAYLRSEKLAIRELANSQLQGLAPVEAKEIPFDPAGDTEQRGRAVTLWKKRIPDGKLPSRPNGPPAK